MNVWVKMTRKRVKCYYCNKMIEAGQYQVICTYFMKLKHSSTTWTKAMHFHARNPDCWLDRAIVELESRPYVEKRGRKADVISDENRIIRLRILRRRASIIQRINNEMTEGWRPAKLVHLTESLDKLAVEIEPYGGVPESWR